MHETAVNRIVALILAQQKGEITTEEQQELGSWTNASEPNRQFVARCMDWSIIAAGLDYMDTANEELAFQRFMEKNELALSSVVPFRKRSYRWLAAAVLVGTLATVAFWLLNNPGQKAPQKPVAAISKGENIQPGFSQATLTLSDGRTITLDDSKAGILAREGGAAVNKQGNELVYDLEERPAGGGKANPVLYHTVTTPTGGNYALTLPDNTKVWLNAEASIRYPTAFIGSERRVEMTGEAYFEVAKKSNQPFIVAVNKVQVKVLGTHFNIRAYEDEEAARTTLLEGSVEVSGSGPKNVRSEVILKPGEQAIVLESALSTKSAILVQVVDIESVIAWKSGYFDFKATPFPDIMKELKRWYAAVENIEIKEPVSDRLTATIPRNVPLSTMLTILEATGKVHFEVKDKTIIVTR